MIQLRIPRKTGAKRPTVWSVADGKWAPADGVAVQDSETLTLSFEPDKAYFIEEPEPAPMTIRRLEPNRKLVLGKLMVMRRDGDAVTKEDWNLSLAGQRLPATWDQSRGAYTASLYVGLTPGKDGSPPAPNKDLAAPITVLFTAYNADIEPETASIKKAGVDGYVKDILLSCKYHNIQPRITAVTDVGQAIVEVGVQAAIASLELSAAHPAIYGWGLEEMPISIRAVAEDGRAFQHTTPIDVTVATTKGRILEPTARIEPDSELATVVLRSAETGTAKVTANAAGISSEPWPVAFVFPWKLLLLGSVIAMIGGFIAGFKGRNKTPPINVPMAVLEGFAAGIIFPFAISFGLIEVGVIPSTAVFECGFIVLSGVAGRYAPEAFRLLKMILGLGSSAPS